MADTTKHDIALIILAAGKGTRMKSDTHKVLHKIGGAPMLSHILETSDEIAKASDIDITRHIIVGDREEQLRNGYPNEHFIKQEQQLGTGDAVKVARAELRASDTHLLVLFGDTPLIKAETITAMINMKRKHADLGVIVLGFHAQDPTGYGRLIVDNDDILTRIVEQKDATTEERAVTLCNSGVMLIDGSHAANWLDQISPANASGEYYLTDIVEIARNNGFKAAVVEGSEAEMIGVNSRADLANAEALFQTQRRQQAMAEGATLIAPETVWFAHDTKLGRDIIIEPNVFFGPNVSVENGVTIKANSHIEGTLIRENAAVGPFARLRPGAEIGPEAKIGNFVEVKKAQLAKGVKVSHLSYIGDASIGADANIGAGTITCNYDGFNKAATIIGEGAFIGSNTALVAPVSVGDGAIVGAGSTITKDVPSKGLAVTRAPQNTREGLAERLREKQRAKKERSKG